MSLEDNAILLLQLAKGNQKAFETLYYAYRTQIFGRILKQVRSVEFAQDIVQDVFVKVWQNRAQIDVSKNFKSYLYTIAQSTVYDYFRKIASDQAKSEQLMILSKGICANDIEEEVSYKEMEKYLNDILDIIPERCREVYVLCKLEGRSYDEVSKLLNISTATINNHIVKATSIIKSHWNWNYCCFLMMLFAEYYPIFRS
ncbi:MAG: sigma-70 family RNA polymerase sigma factor [Sphingobacterium sp.]|jgi:RNA polymerase sigma-70 factor (ECF subfamily)|nr:sigma-70 family RNA polymerase sigma factor [Sphingobacterium sp.]